MKDKGEIFEKLVHIARKNNIRVQIFPQFSYYGRIVGDKIGLASDVSIDKMNYTLAHELAHFYLHSKINVMESPEKAIYEEQADGAARLLLDVLNIV